MLDSHVRRAEVEASVRTAAYPGHDPARWALPLIAEADARAGGHWRRVALTADEADALWLPPHAGEACHGDTMALAGGAGAWLADAAAWLLTHADAYARANPSCWTRIVTARDTSWAPLVVSADGVGDRTGPSGSTTTASDGDRSVPLIVIDGLHRALGWALAVKKEGDDQLKGAGRRALQVFLAGQ